MNQDFKPTDNVRDAAIAYLCDTFFEIVHTDSQSMEKSEDLCIQEGHKLLSVAFAKALERYDKELCSHLPEGVHIHDIRSRSLATKMGDVTFGCRRCRDSAGNTVIPLADALNIPWNARISPAARLFLVNAGAEVSFARSAQLLFSAGGSYVSSTAVMSAVHRTGELCRAHDENLAKSLYEDGVLPDGDIETKDICIESDGTWIKLQNASKDGPERVEIKALVSYVGKETQGAKTKRINPIHHGCVGSPSQFWSQGVATIADKFDLSKIEHAHFGCDGESFYKEGNKWLPIKTKSDTHLDPFHINRAILSCFPASEKKVANNIIGAVIDGGVEGACALIEAAIEQGIAKQGARRVVNYLRNNKDIIYTEGPSLGTMESEQQHLYGARMDSVPCAWSIAGADAMARIRSRKFSKRKFPTLTRLHSISSKRRIRVEKRQLEYLESKIDTNVPMTVGKGTEAEHVASLAGCSAKVRYTAGIDSGMVGIG